MTAVTNEMRLKKMRDEKPLVTGDERIAVFGAGGQIGTKLRPLLEECYKGKIIYCETPESPRAEEFKKAGFELLDITKKDQVRDFLKAKNVKVVLNLAALLSGASANNPLKAYEINVAAGRQLLEIAREKDMDIRTVMMMSSMAIQEFDERRFDSPAERQAMVLLKNDASPTLVRRGNSPYAIHKDILESEAVLQTTVFQKNTIIPRLAGVLSCHVPYSSDGTTEEVDKMITVAAMQEVFPEDWQERVRKLEKPEYLDRGLYLKDGYYVPAVPADATFDMVDSKTLSEAVLMLLHQNLIGHPDIAAPGPVHNVSEYSVSMKRAHEIIQELNPNAKIRFASETTDFTKPLPDGLDRGKTSRAATWSGGQNVGSTVGIIGEYRRGFDPEKSREENNDAIARRSIRENYVRVRDELRALKMQEMATAVTLQSDGVDRAAS